MEPADTSSRLYDAFVSHRAAQAIEVLERARRSGTDQDLLFDRVVAPALAALGAAWADGTLDEYEFTRAAVTAEQVMSFVTPPPQAGTQPLVLGSVRGDSHATRRTILASALTEVGYAVEDLGSDVAASRFVTTAEDLGAAIVIAFCEITGALGEIARLRDLLDASDQTGVVLLAAGGAAAADPAAVKEAGAAGVLTGAENGVAAVTSALEAGGGRT